VRLFFPEMVDRLLPHARTNEHCNKIGHACAARVTRAKFWDVLCGERWGAQLLAAVYTREHGSTRERQKKYQPGPWDPEMIMEGDET